MTPPTGLLGFRKAVDRLFDDGLTPTPASRFISGFFVVMIVFSITTVILDSVGSIRMAYGRWFDLSEKIVTAVFVVEYVLRVWSSVDRANKKFRHPLWGRLRYMLQPLSIIDFIAVLPAFLGDYDLRILRLIRLLRMLKLTRHSSAFSLLWDVVRKEAATIGAVLSVLIMLVIASGSVMYVLEGEAQPQVFSSIPEAMWWSVITITTVGYGDMIPHTVPGKIFGAFVAILGVGAVALFAGVITASFLEQLRVRREQARRAIAAGLKSGRLTLKQLSAIDRIGDELGLEEDEVEMLVETIIDRHGPLDACPHCGGSLSEHRRRLIKKQPRPG